MPKLLRLEYGDLFHNEIRALTRARIYKIPRVIKYIEAARSTDDICLVLEYAWLAFLIAVQSTFLCLHLHVSAAKSFLRAGWCMARL